METPFDQIAKDYDVVFDEAGAGRLQREQVWKFLAKQVFPGLGAGAFAGSVAGVVSPDGVHGRSPDQPGGGSDTGASFALNILELNCGTGRDALWLAEAGHRVWATDVSEGMVAECRRKLQDKCLDGQVSVFQLGFGQLDQLQPGVPGAPGTVPVPEAGFDLIFSNFGGLNCISPAAIRQLGNELGRLLRPGGRAVLVVMGACCAWESLYFMSRLKPGKAFRRWRAGAVQAPVAPEGSVEVGSGAVETGADRAATDLVATDLDAASHATSDLVAADLTTPVSMEDGRGADHAKDTPATLPIWYYRPGRLRHLLGPAWQIKHLRPVGSFLPPSYLGPWFERRPKWLRQMVRMERKLEAFAPMARISDHYILDLEKRSCRSS